MGSPPPGTEKKGRVVSSHWALAGLEVMIGQMKCEASHCPVCDRLQGTYSSPNWKCVSETKGRV